MFGTLLAKSWDRTRDCPFHTGASCHCTDTVLDCLDLKLTEIPTFLPRDWHYETLHLTGNYITEIRPSAFANINVSRILLEKNYISRIDEKAFKGVYDEVEYLDLSSNDLESLPMELRRLASLRTLDVMGNPIQSENFTEEVLRQLGDYLEEFRFGHSNLTEWPSSLHHLPGLKHLSFSGGTMERLPPDAFRGFEWSLQHLWITDTKLIAVPIAMQDLHSTVELHFDNNLRVKDAGILIPAFAGLVNSLDILTLENNDLTEFPPVLLTLKQLSNLSLARNDLQFVSDSAVGVLGTNLTTINLQSCNLDRIPGALSKLEEVVNLDFSYNNITTVEKNDLQGLHHLQTLDLSENRLAYISNSAFKTLSSLRTFLLRNVDLYLVPEAIQNIPSLQLLDLNSLPDPNIECNCMLKWLYCHLSAHTSLMVKGECETIADTIQNYATTQIPSYCPHECHCVCR